MDGGIRHTERPVPHDTLLAEVTNDPYEAATVLLEMGMDLRRLKERTERRYTWRERLTCLLTGRCAAGVQ